MFIRSYRLLGEISEEMKVAENLTPKSSSTFENLMDTFHKQLTCYRNVSFVIKTQERLRGLVM